MGWQKEECKLYIEGSELGFVCNLIPIGHLQYSISEWFLLCCFFISLTSFFSEYFEKGKTKNKLLQVGTPYHSSLISNSYLFLMENIYFRSYSL